MSRYVASTTLPVGVEEAFAYHERHGALERLIPPWQNVVVESTDGSLKPDSVVVLKLKVGPLSLKWVAQHTEYDPPNLFADVQRSGPFAAWEHRHLFEGVADGSCTLRDCIDYSLPFGPLGRFLGGRKARRELESMFSFRHQVTRDDLALAATHETRPLKIAVSGASGLVGRKLIAFLTLIGHHVVRLERSIGKAESAENDSPGSPVERVAPWHSAIEAEKLNGIDAVVHLAGKSIADDRWTDSVKKAIRDSRVDLTTRLAKILAGLADPPKVFVCASATGIYGDRGDEELTERSRIGETFLAEVADEWEKSCLSAQQAGIRVANARLGVVLDPSGGALKKTLLPAKFCGGSLGNGRQWWSWAAIDDVIGAIYHAICSEGVSGPFNVTSPNPLTYGDFAKTLGRVIRRPALIPAPAFGLRLALGEMADALLLSSTRVYPSVLDQTGYRFRFEHAEDALRYLLGVNRLESVE